MRRRIVSDEEIIQIAYFVISTNWTIRSAARAGVDTKIIYEKELAIGRWAFINSEIIEIAKGIIDRQCTLKIIAAELDTDEYALISYFKIYNLIRQNSINSFKIFHIKNNH